MGAVAPLDVGSETAEGVCMNRASFPVALLGLLSAFSLAACSSAAGTGSYPGSSTSNQNGSSSGGSSTNNGTGDDGTGDNGNGSGGTVSTGDDAGTTAPTGGGDDAGGSTTTDGGTTAPKGDAGGTTTAEPFDYAPYFPTWTWQSGGYAYTSLTDLQKKAGVNGVTIAFVLSNGGCNTTQDIEQNLSDVKAFIAAGGHVKASFGGADGAYVESKAQLGRRVGHGVRGLRRRHGDHRPRLRRRAGPDGDRRRQRHARSGVEAGARCQGDQSRLHTAGQSVSGGGLTDEGKSVVSNAVSAGVKISHVNFMTMDYGDSFAGSALAPVVEGSLTDGQKQIMALVPGISSQDAWGMVGVIPMIGKNDDSEVFSLADAKTLTTFATTNDLGLVSFWSIDRDQPGTDYNTASTVETKAFSFTAIFQAGLEVTVRREARVRRGRYGPAPRTGPCRPRSRSAPRRPPRRSRAGCRRRGHP